MRLRRPRLLDRELAFKKWVELGTQRKVVGWLMKNNILNHHGKPFSGAAVSYAARRWVCDNPKEARGYYEDHGWTPSDDEWAKWLVRTLIKCFPNYSEEVIIEWLEENGLREKYGYIIGEGEKPRNRYSRFSR